MGKTNDGTKAKKEPLVPEKDIASAMTLEHKIPVEQDPAETLSMMVMSFTAFGMMKGAPALNFISAFVLLSLYINRPRTRSWFSNSLVSLAMIFFSCGVLYWRLMKGYLPAK